MQKYPAIIGILVASVSLWMGIGAAARLPEGLPNLLKTHNFNIYTVPCPANNMVLRDTNGRVVDLKALRGKVVILNFWKIDCPPCTAEKPILERLYRKYARRGLEIVAVNLFDDRARVHSYARRTGFGFRFCCDPENRFSVRKESLGGGTPSTFIINSNSDAIYEVPGVPTSYLIDRNGQVIGNGVGMVNWEEQPFTALIESLLGPPNRMVAQNTDSFTDVARQGPVANPTVRQAGPRRSKVTESEPADRKTAASTALSEEPADPGRRGPGPIKTLSESPTAKKPVPAKKDLRSKRGRAGSQELRGTKAKSRKKTRPIQHSLKSPIEFGKPKPYRSSVPASGNAGETGPIARHLAQAAPGTPVPRPYVPPRTNAPTSPPLPGPAVRSSLPAAMPYTPPNIPRARNATARPVVPDENGQIMARVPSRYSSPTPKEVESPKPAGSTGSPFARPSMQANPIDTFILDSFGNNASVRRQAPPQALYPQTDRVKDQDREQYPPQEQQEIAPASSLLGQLSRDVRNLGAGIKQTFSGWLPRR